MRARGQLATKSRETCTRGLDQTQLKPTFRQLNKCSSFHYTRNNSQPQWFHTVDLDKVPFLVLGVRPVSDLYNKTCKFTIS